MEDYFTHLIKLNANDQNSLNSIHPYISEYMFEELRYLRAKPFLSSFPIFCQVKSPILLREIARTLQYAMYLPKDYIILRRDVGEEMYFILEGSVQVLTPREDDVLVRLRKGDYFGEIALFTAGSRRICSVVAGSFCEVYILNKKFLEKTMKNFPSLREAFSKESDRRLKQYNNQHNNQQVIKGEEERKDVLPPLKKKKMKPIQRPKGKTVGIQDDSDFEGL